ncbi:MAG: endolytic transglycosylase MltG [Oscillospiraceae bacterium]
MPDDFDKLNEIFGAPPKASEPSKGGAHAASKKKSPLDKLDAVLYDPEKHAAALDEDYGELEERDYKPVRGRRDGKTGCLGGLMYFVFVISVSIILACLAWMAATDVLALNKENLTAEISIPASIFTDKEVDVKDEDGKVTGTKTVKSADIDYVARLLKDSGIIEYKFLFKLFCTVSHADVKLDPGSYELTTDFDYRALVKKMQTGSGAAVTVKLTFPEGWTMDEIFARLEENGVSTKTELYDAAANSAYNYSFLNGDEAGEASRLEGFMFPDTYEFYVGMQASSAINKFLQNLHTKLTADMLKQAENRGMSMKQVITVASMIESEAANDEERATIASIIYNRLEANMPLQIDATVLYALGVHKESVTIEDTKVDSPYNTYRNKGLPPGPISNPGLPSIKAALQPQSTEYYFYALDTESGTHRFFKTLEEHAAFVATQDYTKQSD